MTCYIESMTLSYFKGSQENISRWVNSTFWSELMKENIDVFLKAGAYVFMHKIWVNYKIFSILYIIFTLNSSVLRTLCLSCSMATTHRITTSQI